MSQFFPLQNEGSVNIILYMVPLKLTLKNFLCYRGDVPPLDFSGIHLACLSGQNGHGKSALLDAMTWALWGKARARDDSLIYYGADDMRVELDFGARDDRYRVARRRTKPTGRGRSGSSDLQLQVANGEEYIPITRNSLRETEAEIQRIIGMDYDTFINSAFLLQGRADEFTNKTPSQRKEVLGKLIGLEDYEALQERAKERARERGGEVSRVDSRLQYIQQQLSSKPTLEEKRKTVAEELARLEGELGAKRAERDKIRVGVEALQSDKRTLDDLRQQAERLEQQLVQQCRQIEVHQERIKRYQAVVQSKEAIQLKMRDLDRLRAEYERMNRMRTSYDGLQRRESDLLLVIGQEHSRLEEQAKGLEKTISQDLGPAVAAVPELERKVQEAQQYLDGLAFRLQALESESDALVTLTGEAGRLESQMKSVEAEGKQLSDKQKMMKSSDGTSTCPLCGTPLSEDQCSEINDSYQAEIDDKRALYRGLQTRFKDVTDKRAAKEEVLAERPVLEEQRGQVQRTIASYDANLAKAVEAGKRLADEREKVASLQFRLNNLDYATHEQAELAEVRSNLARLGYDTEAHQRLYRQVQEAQPIEEQAHSLKEAEKSLPEEAEALGRAEEMGTKWRGELADLRRRAHFIEEAVRDLPGLEEELKRHEAAAEGLQRSHDSALQEQGAVEGELKRLGELEAGMPAEQNSLLAAQEAQGLYEELQSALGRQGVQAMLIETLLPKVEDTANELLSRMTDGRMHVKLETQRDRRGGKGGTIETLDITISDELGARAYELFSGGEAFRINLALRIALSKELARRRGAPLPTLFIDEGFGTQDASGRDRILDVMGAIQQDFEKIFVITHLEDLKDAFPVHIQVEKDERGASVWVA